MSRPGWSCAVRPGGTLWTRRIGPLCLVVERDSDGCLWDVAVGEGPLGWGLADREAPSLEAAQTAAEQAARDIAVGMLAALGGP